MLLLIFLFLAKILIDWRAKHSHKQFVDKTNYIHALLRSYKSSAI
jgi:hypothetical protein